MTPVCDNRITPFRLALMVVSGIGMTGVVEARAEDRPAPSAMHSSVDSEHMFGFTTGSDIGAAGEIEIEGESDSGAGKRTGRYFAAMNSLQLKYTPVEHFRIAPHVEFSHHAINGVDGISNINQVALASGGIEFKYRAFDRATSPFGLTFALDTSVGRIDAGTGQRVRDYALDFSAALDREILKDRLFGAINVFYAPGWTRDHATGLWEQSAAIGVGGSLVAGLGNGVFAGGEVRYLRAYESAGLSRFAGEAVFAGPSLYVMFTPRANMTLAWNVQVAGHAQGETGSLDLTNFERHQVRIRFGVGF